MSDKDFVPYHTKVIQNGLKFKCTCGNSDFYSFEDEKYRCVNCYTEFTGEHTIQSLKDIEKIILGKDGIVKTEIVVINKVNEIIDRINQLSKKF